MLQRRQYNLRTLPRVMVVDDRPANRLAFRAVLDSEYSVSLAESGADALALAQSEMFDVILIDVRMPGMDGFETAEFLRMEPRSRYTPIIFTSAYDQTLDQIKKGFVAGATDFLFSPVDNELLRFKVGTYAALHQRYESTKAELRRLQYLVQALFREVATRCPMDDVLKTRIVQLEGTLDNLEGNLSPFPA